MSLILKPLEERLNVDYKVICKNRKWKIKEIGFGVNPHDLTISIYIHLKEWNQM